MENTSPLRVVAIGGGTGLSALLQGLKQHTRLFGVPPLLDITAVVTVSDDGGSSGRLRRDFDVLPPGDIRNCMVALSEDSALLSRLFQYRFASGRAQTAQFRQPVSGRFDADHGGFCAGRAHVLGGAQHRRANLSRDHRQGVAGGHAGQRGQGGGGDADQPQRRPHPVDPAESA